MNWVIDTNAQECENNATTPTPMLEYIPSITSTPTPTKEYNPPFTSTPAQTPTSMPKYYKPLTTSMTKKLKPSANTTSGEIWNRIP